ncbi:cation:proton antiporter [Neoasaia chiangmaiensis]|uniref:Sodium:proton antiporter n=1 Tax=Neoasaia chiangmaiensis TaxID=320497 RepID=A0A1U9KNN2_9PROT|nr:sodium:proton antiporter [Neoasaia chiangmaiensis]AQS87363.1 sodium:proton antiporter [Neoasaia chiangmaiensis]
MSTDILIGILSTMGAGIAAQWVAWRFRLPAIVLLFALGLALGPGLNVLHPSASLGWLFRPFVSLMVAIIVFEGGLILDFRQLREAGEGVIRLTMLALPINWVLGLLAAHYVAHLEWGTAALFGAIITVTGPTVVLPLLRHNKLQPRVAAFLRWEAIINDPIGAILAAVVLQVMTVRAESGAGAFLTGALPDLLASSAEALAAGVLPAYLVNYLFRRDLMPEPLKTPLLLTLALLIFSVCNLSMEGAGLIGATVFGMALTNLHVPGLSELRRMKESLVVLVVSCLFILLTADLHRTVLERLSLPIFSLTLLVLFVVRPVAIFFSTLGTGLTWQERVFVGWIAPRGIVAAAVAGAAGFRLADAGYRSAALIMPAVFAVIAVTMILHGFSLRPLARRLKLTLSNEPALAIVGASHWTLDLASCLHQQGVPVLLVDNRSSALMPAARRSLPILRAELLSQYGEEALEERPADYLIATTADGIYNGMVCAHMAPHMGRQRVFQISPGVARLDFYHGLSRDARGKVLGEPSWNYTLIDTLFEKGWRFVSTTADEASAAAFGNMQNRLDILSIRRGISISIRSAEDEQHIVPAPGDLLVSMLPPPEAESQPEGMTQRDAV